MPALETDPATANTPDDPDAELDTMTPAELAKLLQISEASVRERAKRRTIPGVLEGFRPLRFRRSVVVQWIDEMTSEVQQ